MFTVTLQRTDSSADVLAQAVSELALVVEVQSRLRQSDLARKRDVLAASGGERRRSDRCLDAELHRVEANLLRLARVEAAARAQSADQVEAMRRHLGGLVAAYDLGGGALGVRIALHGSRRDVRMLLLPEPARRMRVQLQTYGKGGPPAGPSPALPVCLGARGDAYTDSALDAMHLPTLVLTFVSYVRTNGAAAREW